MGILSLIEPFYRPRAAGSPAVGDVYWVPTAFVHQRPTILAVERAHPEEHDQVRFRIEQISGDHFRGGRKLPIKSLSLQGNEELLVAPAKRRPCVVVGAALYVDDTAAITDPAQRRLAQSGVGQKLYLVAPMFSVPTLGEQKTFGPQLVARIRALQYPHLFCLPDREHPDRPKSVVRLDLMFPTYLGIGTAPLEYRLSESALEVFVCAAHLVMGVDAPPLYFELREMIKEIGLPADIS